MLRACWHADRHGSPKQCRLRGPHADVCACLEEPSLSGYKLRRLNTPTSLPLRTEAREELRRQVGNLRFDLNTLAQAKPKDEKKKALELRKDFIAKVEALDLSLRKKDQASALTNLSATKTALDTVLASVL